MKKTPKTDSYMDISGQETATGLVPAVEQAARILLFFTRLSSGSANLTEICRALGLYKSRGHAILKTLAAYGFVTRDEATKRYSLGPTLIHLSRKALEHLDIRETAQPYLARIAGQTGCMALLGLITVDHLLVIARRGGTSHLGITIEIGHRFPLTAGAHGKAIVAFLPDEERRKILARKRLFFHGAPEHLDRQRLETELRRCRETGYALDMGDLQRGIHAVASPVFTGGGIVTGALIVVGTFPEKEAHTIGTMLRETTRELALATGARMPDHYNANHFTNIDD